MKDWSGLSTATVPVLCGWVALGQNLPSEGRKDVRTVHASPYHTMQFLMQFFSGVRGTNTAEGAHSGEYRESCMPAMSSVGAHLRRRAAT